MALPALMEELLEAILLRLPPDEPAHLIRAALVCKDWCRIISDGGFRRRYRRFHRTPPLLGYIRSEDWCPAGPQFVPATTFSPPLLDGASISYYTALNCRHGRVLIADIDSTFPPKGFIVWDPITGNQQHLSFPTFPPQKELSSYTGAVLCARRHGGCDHLDCHGGPFLVVFLGMHDAPVGDAEHTSATVYSSETGAWSIQTSSFANDEDYYSFAPTESSLLIGDVLYFTFARSKILKYDLGRHELSLIDTPQMFHRAAAPMVIDGGLGLVELSGGNCICMWSHDGVGGAGWVRSYVAELEALIPTRRPSQYLRNPYDVIRFAEGTDTILFSLNNYIGRGVFTFDLKSRQIRKVDQEWDCDILPYMSFYTPDRSCQGHRVTTMKTQQSNPS